MRIHQPNPRNSNFIVPRMEATFAFLFVIAIVVSSSLLAQLHTNGQSNQIFPERTARDEWQKPVEIIEALNLKNGDTVADIGAGAGYFTGWLSQAVGAEGRVYAVDVSAEAIDLLKKKIGYYPINNIDPVLCGHTDLKLPPQSLDLAFIMNTFSVVTHKQIMMQNAMTALKPHGRLVIIDWRNNEGGPPGPPKADRISQDAVVKMAAQTGFKLAHRNNMLPAQYFLEFTKDSHHRSGAIRH